jgi:hypothetical protein
MWIRALGQVRRAHRFSIDLRMLFLTAIVLISVPNAAQASEEDAKLLLMALTSSDCAGRLQAISRYSTSEDNEQHHNAGLKQVAGQANPVFKKQLSALLVLMADDRDGIAKILVLTERLGRVNKLNKAGRDSEVQQVRQELLRIFRDPKELTAARLGAPWPLVRLIRTSERDHPDWRTEWAQMLGTMLRSSESSSRVVGAVTAVVKQFPEGTDPIKADVVRPLIDGLRHESVQVRSAAYLGLRQALDDLPSEMCFDATDSSDRRARAIQHWERWWKENSEKLARARLVQDFW